MADSSRLKNTSRNIVYVYMYQFSFMAIGFISRYIFVKYLGNSYLGVNVLFANVLAILSVSELGIGSAIGFALYKPLAENNKEKIKSIMALFKKAYLAIGIFVAVAGITISPFLPYVIKNTTGIQNITVYYYMFLFNTVVGYFISYKNTLIISDQKEFKIKKIQTIGNFAIAAGQIAVLVLTRNYFAYLLGDIVIKIVMQLFSLKVINKEYPYLKNEKALPLPKEDFQPIKKNIKALVLHKLGEASIHQTDNIILSAFISLEITGKVSNYTLFTTTALSLIGMLLNAAIPSAGNLIAKESDQAKLTFFKTYRLASYWLQGWASLGFIFLATPLIQLVFGLDFVIPQLAVVLIGFDLFLRGESSAMYNYKVAAGFYDQDKYIALIGGAINLVISIIAVNIMGVSGVFLGTVITSLCILPVRCVIIYKCAFADKAKEVYKGALLYMLFGIVSFSIMLLAYNFIWKNVSLSGFALLTLIAVIVPNLVFYIIFGRKPEFDYYMNLLKTILKKFNKK